MTVKSSTTIWKLRYEIRNILVQYPALYIPLVRLRRGLDPIGGATVVSSNTEIVIEGYPRSANSFAVKAFNLAQTKPVRAAHHLHTAAQVVAAAKLDIPALVLIRDPEEAILSRMLLVAYPYDAVEPAMKEYLRFYEAILPYRQHFVLARYEAVVNDFGAVTRTINHRYGTTFREFDHTDENVKRCFSTMERRNEQLRGSLTETTVSRPSQERKDIKDSLRPKFHAPSLTRLRKRTYRVYETLVKQADI